jgi:predicted NBD/HSP70 family sugar kinase
MFDQDIPVSQRLQHAGQVVARASAGDEASVRAVNEMALALGRGIAALVNAHDPDLVTLSGLGADIHDLAAPIVRSGYEDSLMTFRRGGPALIAASLLGPAGPRVGAAETVFDAFLTAEGLRTWRQHEHTLTLA